jgi:RNA polymerase sigma-70 factor, ECF subfamily
MFRDTTYSDFGREQTWEEPCAGFVMDESEFRAFYDRTARGLWAYLARITGDRQQADDLLQETFYRFLRASQPYENEAHRRHSLYRIATNLARDARRRSLARVPAALAGHEIEAAPSGQDAAAADRGADLTRAMQQLKPRERAMLWLAYGEGASHAEIADTLGLRPGSLKPLLFRARRKLAALLGREADGGRK